MESRTVAAAGGSARLRQASVRLTLQRQLDEQATSFKALVEEVRREHAPRYMQRAELRVHHIAALLGYNDASSFRRAFRRWTGLSPERYRAGGARVRPLAPDAPKSARKVSGVRARA
jgi:AraC-like DNA-binding protein